MEPPEKFNVDARNCGGIARVLNSAVCGSNPVPPEPLGRR
jgi:hypothetical protein